MALATDILACPVCGAEASADHFRENAECSAGVARVWGMYVYSRRQAPPAAGPGRGRVFRKDGSTRRKPKRAS